MRRHRQIFGLPEADTTSVIPAQAGIQEMRYRLFNVPSVNPLAPTLGGKKERGLRDTLNLPAASCCTVLAQTSRGLIHQAPRDPLNHRAAFPHTVTARPCKDEFYTRLWPRQKTLLDTSNREAPSSPAEGLVCPVNSPKGVQPASDSISWAQNLFPETH